MLVGMTFDLRSEYLARGYDRDETAEFDREDTIDSVAGALIELGYTPARIGNVRSLVGRLAAGDAWDIVFNMAEGLHGRARESQVPSVLEAYGIPYTFSDPVTLGISLDKALTKRLLRDAGIATPEFAVLEDAEEARRVALPMPLFAKPLAEGTSKGITSRSRVESATELGELAEELIARYRQPVLVERFLSGREFTVGILGTDGDAEAVGALEVVVRGAGEGGVCTLEDKERCEELVEYRLARDGLAARACEKALDAWRALGCRDAGRVDLRAAGTSGSALGRTEGADGNGPLAVLEVNPLAGLHPTHSDLPMLCSRAGMPYVELIDRIMRSACARAGLRAPSYESLVAR